MVDYFALLDEPRRPWLDPAALKTRFYELSATLHPDRAHGATTPEKEQAHRRFTELNAAYQCLQDPRQRLRHLLELETEVAATQIQEVPAALMDTALEIGRLCRETDAFLKQKAASTSPLLQVEVFLQAQQRIEQLKALRRQIGARRDAWLRQLAALDERWMSHKRDGTRQPPEIISELADLFRLLGYAQRWDAQVQERIVQLAV